MKAGRIGRTSISTREKIISNGEALRHISSAEASETYSCDMNILFLFDSVVPIAFDGLSLTPPLRGRRTSNSVKAIFLFAVAVLAVPVFVSGAPPQEDIVK